MPSRICRDCHHLYDMQAAPGQRCPDCQAKADTTRNARPPRQQRGYTTDHDHERRRQLQRWRPGQPCAIGGEPTWDKTQLDLAHNHDRTGWLGLACRTCNRGHHDAQ